MVALTGVIHFGAFPLQGYYGVGHAFIIAVDGTHHVVGKIQSSTVRVGCAETNTVHYIISQTDWRGHIAAQFAGFVGADFTFFHLITCPGTSKFIMLGQGANSFTGRQEVVGLRYVVNAAGNVAVDTNGKYNYWQGDFPAITIMAGTSGMPLGQIVVGDYVYAALDYGSFFTGFAEQILKLPITADGIDVSVQGAWELTRTNLPGAMNTTSWGSSRSATKALALFPHSSGGIGLLAYKTIYEGEAAPSKLFYGVVDPVTQTTTVAYQDVSALFDIPWSDESTQFDGGAGNYADVYYSPSVHVLAANRIELMFMRSNSDDTGYLRVRRYVMDDDLTNIQAVDILQFEMTTLSIASYEDSYGYREGGDIHWMIRSNYSFYFGTTAVAVPPEDSEPPPEPEPDDDTVVISATPRLLKPYEKPPIAIFRVGEERSIFPLSFFIFEAADLRVTIDDVELDADAFTFAGDIVPYPGYDDADALTADSDYHRKQASVPGFRGGKVTLDTAVTGSIVTIWNDPQPQRGSDSAELMRRDLSRSEFNGRIAGRIFGDLWTTYRAQKLKFSRCVATADGTPLDEDLSGTLVIQ